MEVKDLKLEFVVDAGGFDPGTFMVVDFDGEENISQPFRFEVNLVAYEPDLTLSDVANNPATLEVHRGGDHLIFHGQVAHFDQGPYVGDRFFYTAVLRPALWFLSLRYQSRIFREMTIPEILAKVLADAGLSSQQYKLDLEASYPVREYTVQYHETDLNFVMRWCEHVGIRFHFEGEVVVFSDRASSTAPFIPGEVLVFNPGGGLGASQEAVRRFNCREQVVTGKVVLKDYNYRTPEVVLEAESQLNGEMPGVRYEFGQHFKDVSEGQQLAKVRNEEIECERRVMWGESGYVGLHAGYKLTMKEHYRPGLNGDYMMTGVVHRGTQGASVPGLSRESAKGVNVYTNEFRCVPLDVMYRPPRVTPVPRIPGIMSGRIESAGGDYAHLDEEGRYRSRMYFDRGEAGTAEATHPIRMNEAYSGPDYGIHFPNHKNTEMVWACVDGNPDRPMALGTSPNPSNKSPAVADNKWQNVIRTWGNNELTFDDKKGAENIYMYATKDHTVVVVNNESISVGNDQAIDIGHDRTKHVHHDQSETVDNNKSIQVGANHTETIAGNMSITIGQSLTETVALSYTEAVGVSMSLTVGVNKTETVGGNSSETIGNKKSLQVGADLTETVGKNQTVTIGKDLKEKVGGDHHEEVTKEFAVNAKKIQLLAQDEIVLKTGKAEIIMKKNGDIEIQGKKIKVKGSGDVIIKGKQIKEN